MTPEMHETLTHIQEYYNQHGYSPTYRELTKMTGLSSSNSIHRRVHALLERGHLIRLPGRDRCYVPAKIDLTPVPLGDLLAEIERRGVNHG